MPTVPKELEDLLHSISNDPNPRKVTTPVDGLPTHEIQVNPSRVNCTKKDGPHVVCKLKLSNKKYGDMLRSNQIAGSGVRLIFVGIALASIVLLSLIIFSGYIVWKYRNGGFEKGKW
ncbi:hypothetical protein TYRP_017990 [Tyrophagus putrescentiae]|nr:hypothetical protein TYRP_017990 [Tyrophagus putrescentiae]